MSPLPAESQTDWLQALMPRLTLPLIAAPMFLVSGIELVVATCVSGVVGAFPTVNCRSTDQLHEWLCTIRARIAAAEQATARAAAPWCANLIVHRSNARLQDDLSVLLRHRPELVIASVGSPAEVVAPLHDAGARVLVDVASIRHAERAVAASADGLVLLTAGAGGQTGWLNPLAFVRAVRRFYAGPLVLAGGIADGAALLAAQALGCELAYMGTGFIATHESMADPAYKQMLVDSSADDIVLTRAFTGLATNMLRPSIAAAGLDADALPERGVLDIAQHISIEARERQSARWRDIWSAGHSVGGVTAITSVAERVAQVRAEYEAARLDLRSRTRQVAGASAA